VSLALDGSSGFAAGSGKTLTITLTTTSVNDIIIVQVAANNTNALSVASPTLGSFTRRALLGDHDDIEEWYAVSSTALTGEVITITYDNSGPLFVSGCAFGVSGANTSTIWDSNSSLPATSAASADPTFSTTNATTFVTATMRLSGTPTPTAGTGWTAIYNGSGAYFISQYKIFSSAQTGTTAPLGTGSGDENGSIVDALIPAVTGFGLEDEGVWFQYIQAAA